MTKEEIRALSICKLHLKEDSVCYDIGSGTGSVAVEIAKRSGQIQVFAIEKASCTGTDPEKYREIRSAEYSGNRR